MSLTTVNTSDLHFLHCFGLHSRQPPTPVAAPPSLLTHSEGGGGLYEREEVTGSGQLQTGNEGRTKTRLRVTAEWEEPTAPSERRGVTALVQPGSCQSNISRRFCSVSLHLSVCSSSGSSSCWLGLYLFLLGCSARGAAHLQLNLLSESLPPSFNDDDYYCYYLNFLNFHHVTLIFLLLFFKCLCGTRGLAGFTVSSIVWRRTEGVPV